MMMLARSQHSRWPVAAAAKAALYHFSWQSGAKSRRATLRIASHRIARNPFQANGLRLYRAQFISSVFHVEASLSLSLSRLKPKTRTVEGKQQAEEEDEAEAIRSYRQAVRNERDSCEMPGNVAYAIFLQPSFLRPHRHARIACEERLLWQRQKG